jgi:hypothetical protein
MGFLQGITDPISRKIYYKSILAVLPVLTTFFLLVEMIRLFIRFNPFSVCLLISYCSLYIYYKGNWLGILPIRQKITLATIIIWVLGLHYFAKIEDFKHINTGKTNSGEEASNH